MLLFSDDGFWDFIVKKDLTTLFSSSFQSQNILMNWPGFEKLNFSDE
jgi:hypothetical protein